MAGTEKDEAAFQSLLKALSDLTKGQKEVVEEIRWQNRNKGYMGESSTGEGIETSQNIAITKP